MKKYLFAYFILSMSIVVSFACESYPTCHEDGKVHGCLGGGKCDSMPKELGE